eukprot:jgi/Mesen1/5020/ME000025S04412
MNNPQCIFNMLRKVSKKSSKLAYDFTSRSHRSQWIRNLASVPIEHSKSVSAIGERRLLVRDYIANSLYHPSNGYFTSNPVVASLDGAIGFSKLKGKSEYQQLLRDLYQQHDMSWLTPVEIFQPWYGRAVAEYILQHHHHHRRKHDSSTPLQIYEIGGGTGTCALNVLDYIKDVGGSEVYNRTRYTSVEISEALATQQEQKVKASGGHTRTYSVEHRSAIDVSGWGKMDEQPCYVIMLEVLDNMPHDRVVRETPSAPWQETLVAVRQAPSSSGSSGAGAGKATAGGSGSEQGEAEEEREVLQPLQDSLIRRCLHAMDTRVGLASKGRVGSRSSSWGLLLPSWLHSFWGEPHIQWVPTAAMELLETLHTVRPGMTLIASDFSALPDVSIAGRGAPLVATKKKGVTIDYPSYLSTRGKADIFFPTDFTMLQRIDHVCWARAVGWAPDANGAHASVPRLSAVIDSSNFMTRYASWDKTRTQSAYNPLLEDYTNTKFYLSMPQLVR